MAQVKKSDSPEVMVVNDVPGEECRIAILQDGHLEEMYAERTVSATNVGNIYKGRVNNVESAIQAAFIDYGEEQNGFLHISDLHPRYFPGKERTERVGKKIPRRERPLIQEALKRGDEVLVQVLKEGIGTKGPTLTSYLSIAGRLIVAMPDMDRVGVSRKVEDEEKRREMRAILDSLELPEKFGFILRTAGFGQPKSELKRDAAYLMRLWKTMEKRIKSVKGPCELYAESDVLIRTIRDVVRPTIEAIVVDSDSAYKRVTSFLRVVAPRSAPKVLQYRGKTPIFHAYDVERQIELIHSREVPLPSGGALVIDQTEALVAIDVNSGRSRGARDSETNAYQTNCEAVDEICRQLRLRDLGGLIINDLIDMRSHKNRRLIEERFNQNLKRDRARSTVLRISDFGLVEMTRQRMRPSLRKAHFVPCTHCNGHGEIKSPESVGADAVRQMGYLLQFDRVKRLEIVCSPRVASVLLSSKRRELVRMEDASSKQIDVRVSDAIAVDRVDFYAYDDRNADIDVSKLQASKPPTIAELESAMSKSVESPSQAQESADAAETLNKTTKKKRRRRRKRKGELVDTEPVAVVEAPPAAKPVQEEPTAPVRVHVLAKELGITSKQVTEHCETCPDIDVQLKNHMSMVPPEAALTIRQNFAAEAAEEKPAVTESPSPAEGQADATEAAGTKRRRRRRGGKKHRARLAAKTAAAEASATVDSAKEAVTSSEQQSHATPDEIATVNGHAPAPVKKVRRKSRKRKDDKKLTIAEADAVAAPGPPVTETSPKPSPSKGKKKRKKKDKTASESTTDQPVVPVPSEVETTVDVTAGEKPKRRRTLYRNRSRVSPSAREEAERAAEA